MYRKEEDEKIIRKMTYSSRELTLRLSMSGAVIKAIWLDFYGVLRKHQDVFKMPMRTTAKNINDWLDTQEQKWLKPYVRGFYFALSDYYYEDSYQMVTDLRCSFERNYKKATMQHYELLGWVQLMSYMIEYADILYHKSLQNVEDTYGIDVKSGYKDYDFAYCKQAFNHLYDLIWKRVGRCHTKPNVVIDNNTPECQSLSKKLIMTYDDKDWMKERLRKAKMVYDTNMFGYAEFG